MKSFQLTEGELKVAKILVQSCLSGMGGKRPSDLEQDEYTWINIKDLTDEGYSRHQAVGFFSSLIEKGFIEQYSENEWIVATSGWQWLDTVWDTLS